MNPPYGSRNLARAVLANPVCLRTVSLVVLSQHLGKVEGVGEDAVLVEDGPGEPVVAPLGGLSSRVVIFHGINNVEVLLLYRTLW